MAGQLDTPRGSSILPLTNHRSTMRSECRANCVRDAAVSRRWGMRSPNRAFDMRATKASRPSCAWESALITPYLISMPCSSAWADITYLFECQPDGRVCVRPPQAPGGYNADKESRDGAPRSERRLTILRRSADLSTSAWAGIRTGTALDSPR